MRIAKIHEQLVEQGHKVKTVRIREGALEVVTPRRSKAERERDKDPERDAQEDAAWAAANAEGQRLRLMPSPMSYLEALGRSAMGERTAEVRNTIAAEVARMAAERA